MRLRRVAAEDFEPARFAFPYSGEYAVQGFFAHLDFAFRRPEGSCPEELLFLADLKKLDGTANMTATNVRLPLPGRTLRGCLRSVDEGAKPREKERAEASGATRFAETFARPFVTLLLHLCAKNSEVVPADGSEASPENSPAAPGKKNSRTRTMVVEGPTTWEVGWRLGASVRAALARAEAAGAVKFVGPRRRPRGHIRRAHRHGYWVGPKATERAEERRKEYRWIPTPPINCELGDDGLPADIQPVEGDTNAVGEGDSDDRRRSLSG